MLDIKYMRENREAVLAAMAALGAEDAPVEPALALDERRRVILTQVEVLRAERNTGSKQIGALMREGKREEAEALKQRMTTIGDRDQDAGRGADAVEADFNDAMLRIPNLPHPSVPVGKDETRERGRAHRGRDRGFRLRRRSRTGSWARSWASSTSSAGVKLSGTRFYVLKGAGARLQRALITWMLDLHTEQARLHRGLSAVHGQGGDPGGHGQPAEVRRQPLPRRRGGLLVDPDGRGAGDQPVPRRDPGRRAAADLRTWPTRPASGARR